MESSLDQRIRKNLESIRDDFRLLYLKHPPLYHQRFSSPMETTRAGWQNFAQTHFRGEGDYLTYVAPGNEFLGLLSLNESYGDVLRSKDKVARPRLHAFRHPGYRDFLRLCHRLGMLLFRIPIGSIAARSDWMDIVHDLAELQASPILRGGVDVWDDCNLPIMATGGGQEKDKIDDSLLAVKDERSDDQDPFPAHPLVSSLDRDVFRASAAAIDLLVDPQGYFVWRRYNPEMMPFDLTDLTTSHTAIVPVSAVSTVSTQATTSKPDFLFAKAGNIWQIRFRTGDTVESSLFKDALGFAYYFRLLQSGMKGMKALDLSPTDSDADENLQFNTVDSDEAAEWLGEDSEFSGSTLEGDSYQRIAGEDLLTLMNEIESLKAEITNLEECGDNKELLKELKKDLRRKERELRQGVARDPSLGPAYKAFNRVKANLRRARMAIAGGKTAKSAMENRSMPNFALFLEGAVRRSGFGWKYMPSQQVQWSFSIPE